MQLLSSSISHILRVWGEGAHPDDGIPNMRLLPPPHPLRRPPVKLYSQSRLAMLPPPRTPRPKKPAKKPTHTQKKITIIKKKSPRLLLLGSGIGLSISCPALRSHHSPQSVGIGTQSPGMGAG